MKKVPQKYERVARLFQRFVRDAAFGFTDEHLLEAFEVETLGIKHDITNNGFVFGKKAFDITVAAWKEDLLDGLICKYELLEDYEEGSFEREFIWNIIKDFPVGPLFGYMKWK